MLLITRNLGRGGPVYVLPSETPSPPSCRAVEHPAMLTEGPGTSMGRQLLAVPRSRLNKHQPVWLSQSRGPWSGGCFAWSPELVVVAMVLAAVLLLVAMVLAPILLLVAMVLATLFQRSCFGV